MDLKESVSDALDTFEGEVGTEYLEGRDGLRGAPDNIANHTASRKAALAWAEQYFKICAVRSSRGRHVRTAQSTATSELRLMAAIEDKAAAHRFAAGPSNPVWDVLDLSEDAVVEGRRQCYAAFWKHEMNTTLLELDRRYQEEIRSQSTSPSKESASDTTRPSANEGSPQPAPPTSTPATEAEVAFSPATPSSPSQEDPQSSDQPLQVFTWTNWKGETFSSDYSEAYRKPTVAQTSRSRRGKETKSAGRVAERDFDSPANDSSTAPSTTAPCSHHETFRESHESTTAEAATSSGDTPGSQRKVTSFCASDRVQKPPSTQPTISPGTVLHRDTTVADRRLDPLPANESESHLPLVMPLASGDTVLKTQQTDHQRDQQNNTTSGNNIQGAYPNSLPPAMTYDTSPPIEKTPAAWTPETGANEALSGGILADHAERRTVRATIERYMGEMRDEVYAVLAGFCVAAAVRLALLILH